MLVFAPEAVIQKNATLLKAAVSPDLGLVWSKDGVSRLFASKEFGASNLYKAPTSVVLVTADRFATFGLLNIYTLFIFVLMIWCSLLSIRDKKPLFCLVYLLLKSI